MTRAATWVHSVHVSGSVIPRQRPSSRSKRAASRKGGPIVFLLEFRPCGFPVLGSRNLT